MKVDKSWGLSSYFMYRYGFDANISISDKYPNHIEDINFERTKVKNSKELELALKDKVTEATNDGEASALRRSGFGEPPVCMGFSTPFFWQLSR